MTVPEPGNSYVRRDSNGDDAELPVQGTVSKRALGTLLGLVLLVNLSMSLYQLPLNRVIERRLCREYYAAADPTVFDPHGEVSEDLCKIDAVQSELAWIQGAMETAWIVGGRCLPVELSCSLGQLTDIRQISS